MPEKTEFEVHLEAPGIGALTVLAKIIAIPQPNGYYEPQYQITGKTPEDTAKLCQINDVQTFLDYSAPGALRNNAEHLADALGGIAVSSGAVEGLPKGADLNVNADELGPQARQTITDTINRCKAQLRNGRAPDMPANDGQSVVPGRFQRGVFGGAGVTPVATGPNDPTLPSPVFGTRNTSAPAPSPAIPGSVGQVGDRNGGDWWKSVAAAASPNSDPSSLRGLTSPMPCMMPVDPNQPSRTSAAPLGIAGGAPGAPAPTASPAASGIARPPSTGNPVWDWWNGLVADVDAISRRNGFGGLNTPMLGSVPSPPTQPVFDRGLPGMLQRSGAFDPPAGGLLGMLQELERNHPDDDASARFCRA